MMYVSMHAAVVLSTATYLLVICRMQKHLVQYAFLSAVGHGPWACVPWFGSILVTDVMSSEDFL